MPNKSGKNSNETTETTTTYDNPTGGNTDEAMASRASTEAGTVRVGNSGTDTPRLDETKDLQNQCESGICPAMTTTWETFHAIHAEVDPILDAIRRAEDAAWHVWLRRPDEQFRVYGIYVGMNLINRTRKPRNRPKMGQGRVFNRGEGEDSGTGDNEPINETGDPTLEMP